MKTINLLLVLVFFCSSLPAQKKEQQFTVVFYNVENLFDTEDEPGKEDREFLPASDRQWTPERYETKLEHIAEVLSTANEDELPEIIGLCEVENRQVLEELVDQRKLRRGKYGIIHEDSPDARGIDVALLYRADAFAPAGHETIPVTFPFDSAETTRDILHVWGETDSREIFHFFVNHWPSRRDGQRETEPKRLYASIALRQAVDEVLYRDPEGKLLIIGDFNDEPTNRSLCEMLLANNKRKNASSQELFNMMYDMHNLDADNDTGTYNYRGNWNMLDQIIVSQNVIRGTGGYHAGFEDGRILKKEFMLYFDQNLLEGLPNRTYGGTKYYGGYSDHLPVYVVLKRQ